MAHSNRTLIWWLPLAAGILTGLLWRHRHSAWSRPLLFAWGFFCVALVPVMGFTDVGFMQFRWWPTTISTSL